MTATPTAAADAESVIALVKEMAALLNPPLVPPEGTTPQPMQEDLS
jgi:hypothetical protein